jgi:hypothetical protein
MKDLSKLEYAPWLEETLHNIVGMPVESICIMIKYEGHAVGTNYYNVSMHDKLAFAGYLQQDAMFDTMRANGMIADVEDDEETDD